MRHQVHSTESPADKVYFADAAQHPDLNQLRSLGVNLPAVNGKPGEYFIEASWEQIDKHPADAFIYDAREGAAVTAAVDEIATWPRLPAVQAGQVYPWHRQRHTAIAHTGRSIATAPRGSCLTFTTDRSPPCTGFNQRRLERRASCAAG